MRTSRWQAEPDTLALSKVSLTQYHRVEKTKGWGHSWCWRTLHTQQPTYNHLQTFHLFIQQCTTFG